MISANDAAQALLQANYFPRQKKAADELPPLLTSADLTIEIAKELSLLSRSRTGFDSVELGQTRADGKLRLASIPHPAPYCKLVTVMHEHWDKLSHVCENKASRLRPRMHGDGRIFVLHYGSWKTTTLAHLKESFGTKFIVKADIANFFGSIYTHSIPWALVGIKPAKAAIGTSTWFNELDSAFQSCKRKETNGLAVGPGTSNIAAEVLLAKVDKELTGFLFHRYIDDYTAFCESRNHADKFLANLEMELGKFKLFSIIGKH